MTARGIGREKVRKVEGEYLTRNVKKKYCSKET